MSQGTTLWTIPDAPGKSLDVEHQAAKVRDAITDIAERLEAMGLDSVVVVAVALPGGGPALGGCRATSVSHDHSALVGALAEASGQLQGTFDTVLTHDKRGAHGNRQD